MFTAAVSFVGGSEGDWQVTSTACLRGDPIASATRLSRVAGLDDHPGTVWQLRSFTSNLRYTTSAEKTMLDAKSAPLGRPDSVCGALIPIRKSASWWTLAQDERRQIYEERSRHTSIGLNYLPQIARKLHHCRDLGEPFDFLTWFEFAPAHVALFDELVGRLRETEEWDYVDREIDMRVQLIPR
jgi:chlorite dismutase